MIIFLFRLHLFIGQLLLADSQKEDFSLWTELRTGLCVLSLSRVCQGPSSSETVLCLRSSVRTPEAWQPPPEWISQVLSFCFRIHGFLLCSFLDFLKKFLLIFILSWCLKLTSFLFSTMEGNFRALATSYKFSYALFTFSLFSKWSLIVYFISPLTQ